MDEFVRERIGSLAEKMMNASVEIAAFNEDNFKNSDYRFWSIEDAVAHIRSAEARLRELYHRGQ